MCIFTILRKLDATTKMHEMNAKARATYANARAKSKDSDREVL